MFRPCVLERSQIKEYEEIGIRERDRGLVIQFCRNYVKPKLRFYKRIIRLLFTEERKFQGGKTSTSILFCLHDDDSYPVHESHIHEQVTVIGPRHNNTNTLQFYMSWKYDANFCRNPEKLIIRFAFEITQDPAEERSVTVGRVSIRLEFSSMQN